MSGVHVRVLAGGEHYAVPVERVIEATEVGDLTPVPGAPPEVLGVRNLRGAVVPVIDLRRLLRISATEPVGRIVVAEHGERRAGLAVESIVAVDELPDATEQAPSRLLRGAALMDGQLVGVLDLEAAFDAVAPPEVAG
jgi:purine-binding chemotaxis protein CheW